MKNVFYAVIAAAFLSGLSGCHLLHQDCDHCNTNCRSCGVSGCLAGDCSHRQAFRPQARPAGPPAAAVGYPYYTHRGPRDFFMKNPIPLGP